MQNTKTKYNTDAVYPFWGSFDGLVRAYPVLQDIHHAAANRRQKILLLLLVMFTQWRMNEENE